LFYFNILFGIIFIQFLQSKVFMSEIIRLSRGFKTVEAKEAEPHLMLRSAAALTLGILPFTIHTLARRIFNALACLGDMADQRGYTVLRRTVGVFGVPAAAIMVGSAKVFAFTQLLVWKHYVRNPESDGVNTRLAWYGADHLPWNDLKDIAGAFFNPSEVTSDKWRLKQWKSIQI